MLYLLFFLSFQVCFAQESDKEVTPIQEISFDSQYEETDCKIWIPQQGVLRWKEPVKYDAVLFSIYKDDNGDGYINKGSSTVFPVKQFRFRGQPGFIAVHPTSIRPYRLIENHITIADYLKQIVKNGFSNRYLTGSEKCLLNTIKVPAESKEIPYNFNDTGVFPVVFRSTSVRMTSEYTKEDVPDEVDDGDQDDEDYVIRSYFCDTETTINGIPIQYIVDASAPTVIFSSDSVVPGNIDFDLNFQECTICVDVDDVNGSGFSKDKTEFLFNGAKCTSTFFREEGHKYYYSVQVSGCGSHELSVRCFDNVGNYTDSTLNSFLNDLSPPFSIKYKDIDDYVDVTGTTKFTNDRSGKLVAEVIDGPIVSYRWDSEKAVLDGTEEATDTISCPDVEGEYLITCSVTDAYGNTSVKSTTIVVDVTPPAMNDCQPVISFAAPAGSRVITTINTSWNASADSLSGVREYDVSYKINNGLPVATKKISSEQEKNCAFDISTIARNRPNTLIVSLCSTDSAGNIGVLEKEVILPRLIECEKVVFDQNDDFSAIFSDLVLNITESEIKNYNAVYFTRDSVPGRTPLPPDITNKEQLWDGHAYSINDAGNVVLRDVLYVSSGVGHKYISYAISANTPNSQVIENAGVTVTGRLPSTPGIIYWIITDASGNQMMINPSGIVERMDEGFLIQSDGKITVNFLGEDVDSELWKVFLDKRTEVHGNANDSMIEIMEHIGGNEPILYFALPEGNGSVSQGFTVYLSYNVNGKSTNSLVFNWQEITDDNAYINRSETVNIVLEPPKYGSNNYFVGITDECASYDQANGITIHPGEILSMTAGLDDSESTCSYRWDFGDMSDDANSISVTHAYEITPNPLKCDANYLYQMLVHIQDTVSGTTTIPVKINVLDTQSGSLYVSERWRGDHVVKGTVIVPNGLSLSINTIENDGDSHILFTGSLLDRFPGLLISSGGSLDAGNNAKKTWFDRFDESISWEGIYVETNAIVTMINCDVRHAMRAASVIKGSVLDIQGCSFIQNDIAIHAFGGAICTVRDSVFTGNSLYGIKEENGARPVLTGNAIFGNFRDYYSFDQGLITIEDLNMKNGNAGNKGE